ncbi:hypothetical protein LV564_08645 [Komagataeibacter nataicola]|nr:hypothetical protein [Komagataeibacter nataicola]WEQ57101.1 hypothetical protein LV564_08645 [Komagataeibacter nataicola]WNM08645.1 hypothetical protein RI056_17855 [Komagataeibacter nataicola]
MEDQLQWALAMNNDWRSDLEVWLAPFLSALGHKALNCPGFTGE